MADGPLEVHAAPSRGAAVVERLNTGDHLVVTGMSAQVESIDGRTGAWLRVSFASPLAQLANQPDSYPRGWVFGAAVEGFADRRPRRVELPRTRGPLVWTTGADDFRYTDVPGTYVWLPGASEARHLTYRGEIIEARAPEFTADYRYMINAYGTGPGLRGFSIIELAPDGVTDRVVAEGSYLGRFSFDGTTVQMAFAMFGSAQISPDPPPPVRAAFERCVAGLPEPVGSRTPYARFQFNIHSGEYALMDCVLLDY